MVLPELQLEFASGLFLTLASKSWLLAGPLAQRRGCDPGECVHPTPSLINSKALGDNSAQCFSRFFSGCPLQCAVPIRRVDMVQLGVWIAELAF